MAATASKTFLTQGDERGVEFNIDDNSLSSSSQSTRLHKKIREMKMMDQQLDSVKNEFSQRMDNVCRGEQRFHKKQQEMIESIRRFKTFIVETDTKRQRAERKAEEERKQIEKYVQQIAELERKLESVKQQKNEILRKYECLKPNENYLKAALQMSDDFAEIEELLNRHKILQETNADLQNRATWVQHTIMETQNSLTQLIKEKQNEILVKNSELAQRQQELEEASSKTSSLENRAESVHSKATETICRFGQVHQAVRNLYQRVNDSRSYSGHARKRIHIFRFEEFRSSENKKKSKNSLDSVSNDSDDDQDMNRSNGSSSNSSNERLPRLSTSSSSSSAFGSTAYSSSMGNNSVAANSKLVKERNKQVLLYLQTLLNEIGNRVVELQDITSMKPDYYSNRKTTKVHISATSNDRDNNNASSSSNKPSSGDKKETRASKSSSTSSKHDINNYSSDQLSSPFMSQLSSDSSSSPVLPTRSRLVNV